MNSILALDPEFSERFVMTLAHFLWQGAAIGLAVFVLGLVLRRAPARLRYGIFLTALLAMALCPPVTYSLLEPAALDGDAPPAGQPFELGQPDQPSTMVSVDQMVPVDQTARTAQPDPTHRTDPSDPSDPRAFAPANAPGGAHQTGAPALEGAGPLNHAFPSTPATPDWRAYTPYLILAYAVGVLLMLARLALGLAGGGRLRNRADRITDHAILNALNRHAGQLRLRAIPVVAYCQRVAVPTVVGVIRPMILLPASLATGMPPQQVELLLLHELAHIRRYDHVINILQRLIEAALFFHPALWYVSHRIRVEREHCCDDLVIALGGERHAYAESLVAAAALATGARLSPAALAATGKPSQLRRRIHRLLGDPQPPVRLVRGGWVLTALAAIALVAGATQVANLNTAEPERENFAQAESTPEPVAPADVTSGPAETRPEPSEVPVVEERTTGIDPNVADPTPTVPVAATRESAQTGAQPGDASADSALIPAEETKELTDKYSELSSQKRDPDWWLRKVAVQQIGDLPYHPQFVLSLILSLKDEDPRVQAAAAEGLAKQGDPDAVKHLVAALKEESQVREVAAEALTHFKPEEVMPLLSLAARDDDQSVCQGAIAGLGKQNTPEAAAVLVELLSRFYGEPVRRPQPVRGRPVLQLGPLGHAIAEAFETMDADVSRTALAKALAESDWKARVQAAFVVGDTELRNDQALQRSVLALLQEDRKDLRAAAVRVFSNIVEDRVKSGQTVEPNVIAALEPALRDGNREIAHTAALSLRAAGWQPPSLEERAWFLVAAGQCDQAADLGSVAYEPLVHALRADSTPAFSISGDTANFPYDVVEGLQRIDDPRKVEALIGAIRIAPDKALPWIAESLGETKDPSGVDALVSLLGHLDEDVRQRAAKALGQIGDERAVAPLTTLLNDSSWSARGNAIWALGEIGDPRAAEVLRPLLDSGSRESVATALGKLGDKASAPTILKLYRETEGFYGSDPPRWRATPYGEALAQIGGPEVRDGMIEILLQNPDGLRREEAAKILGQHGDPAAIPALRDALFHDTEKSVNIAACTALGEIGGEEAVQALTSQEDSRDTRISNLRYGICKYLADALSKIHSETSSEGLARLYNYYSNAAQRQVTFEARLVAAKTLAERGDPRGKTMLEELRDIPETRVEAAKALHQLEQQTPEAEGASPDPAAPPAAAPDPTDQSDRSDPSDQAAANTQQTSRLTGPRLQFRWVVEGDEAEGAIILPAPTQSEPDRTLAVGDEVIFYERHVLQITNPNSKAFDVWFLMTEDSSKLLQDATETDQGKRLAIILDGRVLSAPVVQAPISKIGQITRSLTKEEAEVIANAINKALGINLAENWPVYRVEKTTPVDERFLYDKVLRREGDVVGKDLREPFQPEVIQPEAKKTSRLTGPRLQFRWVVEGDEAEGATVLPAPTEDEPDRTLAVGDEVILYEGGIANAEVRKNPDTDHYEVLFEVNERWSERLMQATEQNKGKKLAIVFEGRILSAPIVQAPFGKSGAITGDFTQEEAEAIAKAITGKEESSDDEPLPEPFLYDAEMSLDIPVREERLEIYDPDATEPKELPEPYLYDSGYIK
jgi:HEAT repeat protein/beta-lactamase regulating signal transducer with metallopeptidase domain